MPSQSPAEVLVKKVFQTTQGPKKKIKNTPGAMGSRIYNEWKNTCTSQIPKGDDVLWRQLNKHIQKYGGFNKAGVGEYRNEIQEMQSLYRSN